MKFSLFSLLLVQSMAAQWRPDQWPKSDLSRYLAIQNGFDNESRTRVEPQRSALGTMAMIAGTSEPLAVHAGLEVLKHGGNAADAALTTALAQVALTAGAAISYAGILTAVYYDASSGKVYTLNAGYNTVQNEKDPLSIISNTPGKPEYEKEALGQGDFPQSVIDGVQARGQPVKLVDRHAQPGYWIGIQIGPHSHGLRGAGTPLLPALVEGY
jgi:hypothetical protein